jgi:hypothetical protein
MKEIRFNKNKDEELKKLRGIGFDEIIEAINAGKIMEEIDHPNQKKYPKQRIYLINLRNYIYSVPFIEESEYYFLKTIYPSRKYKKNLKIK